jgi:hypothetical protein
MLLFLGLMLMSMVGCIFDSDGVVDPAASYQHWRQDQYKSNNPSAPFFYNWTYLTATNQAGMSAAFQYYYVYDKNGTATGIYVLASLINTSENTNMWQVRGAAASKLIYYDTSNSNACQIKVNPASPNPDYSITYLGNNQYQFKGAMIPANLTGGYESIKFSNGTYKGAAFNASTANVSWDITYTRTAGWFGQKDIENQELSLMKSGTILWNTYMHDATVSGTLTINGDVYTFNRGYSDQNWNRTFPQGKSTDDPKNYRWGWYHLSVPNTNVSIIAGVGRYNTGGQPFPNDVGIMEAFFSDIRYNGKHVGVRYINTNRSCPTCWGTNLLFKASTGTLNTVTITQDPVASWATLTDSLGSITFPLNQTVYMETSALKVTMAFHATVANTFRIPYYAAGGIMFSDMETLNCTTDYNIQEKVSGVWVTRYSGTTNAGGLEYGYKKNPL